MRSQKTVISFSPCRLKFCSWLHCRDSKKSKGETDSTLHKEVVGVSKFGEVHSLAELVGKEWLLLGAQWSLQLQTSSCDDGQLFELAGQRNVSVYLSLLPFFVKKQQESRLLFSFDVYRCHSYTMIDMSHQIFWKCIFADGHQY